MYKGHTKNYLCVEIKGSAQELQNKIVKAKIQENKGDTLVGKIMAKSLNI